MISIKTCLGIAVIACVFLNRGLALTLSSEGKTDFSIVLDANASAADQTAARELQAYLRQVTGASFSINGIRDQQSIHTIWVGRDAVEPLAKDIAWSDLRQDSIVIRTVDNGLLLAGVGERGTLYAVYTFLQDTLGVRWWTATEEYVPRIAELKIPPLNVIYTPPLAYREVLSHGIGGDLFAVKMRLNGHWNNLPASYGGHTQIIGWCHTFNQFLPPERYFKEHPEWYSLVNGKRTSNKSQLCLTNDAMRKEMTRVVLERIGKNPSAGMISVSQNDWDGWCECDACKAIEVKEGGVSGPLLQFVNAVAGEVAQAYPDFKVVTLAYSMSQKPPAHIKPAQNVSIQLCSTDCQQTVSLDEPENRVFAERIQQWNAMTSNMLIWDYMANFRHYTLPHPGIYTLGPNTRFLSRNGVIGIFQQGDAKCPVGDWLRLKAWVAAQLLWNPQQDDQKLIREFLAGYYGEAANSLESYLMLVRDAFKARGKKLIMDGKGYLDADLLSLDQMAAAMRDFDKAEQAVAHNPAILARVRRERIPLTHLWLREYTQLKAKALAASRPIPGPESPAAACEDLIASVNKEDGWFTESASPGNNAYRFILNDKVSGRGQTHENRSWMHYVLTLNGGQASLKVYPWRSGNPNDYAADKPLWECAIPINGSTSSYKLMFVNNYSHLNSDPYYSDRDQMYVANFYRRLSRGEYHNTPWILVDRLNQDLGAWIPHALHANVKIVPNPLPSGPRGMVAGLLPTLAKGKVADMEWRAPLTLQPGETAEIAFDMGYIRTGNSNWGHSIQLFDGAKVVLRAGHYGNLKSAEAIKYEDDLRNCFRSANEPKRAGS